jgi:glycosyltransferase involved in cell wall biosynthesis
LLHSSEYGAEVHISNRERLLFICLERTSFVEDDIALLQERYDVRIFEFGAAPQADTRVGRAVGLLGETMRQFRWLRRELPRAELVYGWFADYHLALPVLMARRAGVPVAVVPGGFDANHLPELGYGVFDSSWRAPLARRVLRRADVLLPVTQALIHAENRYATWPEPRAQGLRAHVPNLQTPAHVTPLAMTPADWPAGPDERERVVASVALVDDERTVRVKGLDVLVEAARRLPDVRFRIIGVAGAFASVFRRVFSPPGNVTLEPSCPRAHLSDVYTEASVYAQLSRIEAFGCVVAEAMLSGCVPVASPVSGLPEVIGPVGHWVERPDPGHAATMLRRALDDVTPEQRRDARTRITKHFSKAQRREHLFGHLRALRADAR